MKKILIILALAISNIAMAQEKKPKAFFNKNKWSITASVAHAKDIPLFSAIGISNVFSNPIKPWYAIGLEKSYKQTTRARKYYGVELNYHDHKYIDKSIGATLIGGFDRKVVKGIYGGLGLGLGYQIAKRADIVYTYENSQWEPNVFDGKWQYKRPILRFSAELGYQLARKNISIFTGASFIGIQKPFGPDVPLALYQSPIKIGIRKGLSVK